MQEWDFRWWIIAFFGKSIKHANAAQKIKANFNRVAIFLLFFFFLKFYGFSNDLTKKGCVLLAEKGLSILPNLVSLYLDFNWNDIGDDGLMSIVESGLNKNLVNFYLNLEWNEISQKAFGKNHQINI